MIERSGRRAMRPVVLILGLLATVAVCAEAVAASGAGNALISVDGVRVLRLSGTPYSRGFTHGNRLADDILASLDQVSGPRGMVGGTAAYVKLLSSITKRMSVSPEHKRELEGILNGIKAKFRGTPVITPLAREITYDDLLTINCIADALGLACSSFAAWGALTTDGDTLAGRNLDWFVDESLFGQELVIVHAPDPARSALGWVSITWPGLIGCYTGMNSEGVTVSVHDVAAGRASEGDQFVPRTFALRDAIEGARADSAVADVARILRSRAVMVGNNVAVTMPYTGNAAPSAVLEYDSNVTQHDGVTVRPPKASMHQVCTNHYRNRAKPTACPRYQALSERLASADQGPTPVSMDDAWSMLEAVAFKGRMAPDIITFTSVVFEPNKRKMHVAFATRGRPAPYGKRVTLDVAKLLLGTAGAVGKR